VARRRRRRRVEGVSALERSKGGVATTRCGAAGFINSSN
jgi:hypothetical protein